MTETEDDSDDSDNRSWTPVKNQKKASKSKESTGSARSTRSVDWPPTQPRTQARSRSASTEQAVGGAATQSGGGLLPTNQGHPDSLQTPDDYERCIITQTSLGLLSVAPAAPLPIQGLCSLLTKVE